MPVQTDLEIAFDALRRKTAEYDILFRYFDGKQPTVYATQRLRELFKNLDAQFTENWCAVVVRTVLDRLHLAALASTDDNVSEMLQAAWDEQLGDLLQEELNESVAITGEGFIIAWYDSDGLQITHNDPRLVHVVYEPSMPNVKKFAAKWWIDDERFLRMVLYYRDHIEYYRSRSTYESVASAAAFERVDDDGLNPWGVIPVFHFRRSRRIIAGELVDVIPLQNGINKLAADMMVAAEYGAFRQRFIISSAGQIGKLRNAPNEIWAVPGGDGIGQPTQVGEFSATDLRNYLDAIENRANTIATISATPRHFFFQHGGSPSGEALITEEAPLVAKVRRYQRAMTPVWQEFGAFVTRLLGRPVRPADIVVRYDDAALIQPKMQAEITKLRVSTGIPLTTALAWEGFTDREIASVIAARDEENARQQTTFGQALLEAARRRDALRTADE